MAIIIINNGHDVSVSESNSGRQYQPYPSTAKEKLTIEERVLRIEKELSLTDNSPCFQIPKPAQKRITNRVDSMDEICGETHSIVKEISEDVSIDYSTLIDVTTQGKLKPHVQKHPRWRKCIDGVIKAIIIAIVLFFLGVLAVICWAKYTGQNPQNLINQKFFGSDLPQQPLTTIPSTPTSTLKLKKLDIKSGTEEPTQVIK